MLGYVCHMRARMTHFQFILEAGTDVELNGQKEKDTMFHWTDITISLTKPETADINNSLCWKVRHETF